MENQPDPISYDPTFLFSLAAIFVILVTFVFLGFTYGNGTVYDTINPIRQYIDENGEYHFSGVLETSHCGSLKDHIFGFNVYEFTVSREQFTNSFTTRSMRLHYQCINGQITNIQWE